MRSPSAYGIVSKGRRRRRKMPTKSLLRKSPTSSTVDGPPMLRKTMAVGPCEPALFCVTGYVGVASHRRCCRDCVEVSRSGLIVDATDVVAALQSWVVGRRKAMLEKPQQRY